MAKRRRESFTNTERHCSVLKRPLAAIIGAAAVFGSQAQATHENIYKIPPIQQANQNDHDTLKMSVAIDSSASSSYRYTRSDLSGPFVTAFENALHSPIVQLGINESAMRTIEVRMAAKGGNDNGTWDSRSHTITLLVSINDAPPEERLYTDSRLLQSTLEHETFHALNEDWYHYERIGEASASGVYKKLLETAQMQFNNNLEATIGKLNSLCESSTPADTSKYDLSCINPAMLTLILENAHKCIDEGHSLREPLGRITPLPIGHPYDNLTETSSSLLTSLSANPTYVKDCLADTSDETAVPLRKLSGTILKLAFMAHPALETHLREDSEKAEAIDWILEVA